LGVFNAVDEIYRFLDKLNSRLKTEVEEIAFKHTQNVLGGKISIVFYDMIILHFEATDEYDLRRTGFSKDGKHQNPHIYLGLLKRAFRISKTDLKIRLIYHRLRHRIEAHICR